MSWRDELQGLTHGERIAELFGLLFEDWMTDADQDEFVRLVLAEVGVTLPQLDVQMQEGVDAGVPVELLVDVLRRALKGVWQN